MEVGNVAITTASAALAWESRASKEAARVSQSTAQHPLFALGLKGRSEMGEKGGTQLLPHCHSDEITMVIVTWG